MNDLCADILLEILEYCPTAVERVCKRWCRASRHRKHIIIPCSPGHIADLNVAQLWQRIDHFSVHLPDCLIKPNLEIHLEGPEYLMLVGKSFDFFPTVRRCKTLIIDLRRDSRWDAPVLPAAVDAYLKQIAVGTIGELWILRTTESFRVYSPADVFSRNLSLLPALLNPGGV
jgi:hypothetical protein